MEGRNQGVRLPEEKGSERFGRVLSFLLVNLIYRDLSIDMSKLKLSDTKASTSSAERRTSQRTTRSTSRQLKEVNPEIDSGSKTTDGQRSPGMWTPGILSADPN
jgi:hypothetical protein